MLEPVSEAGEAFYELYGAIRRKGIFLWLYEIFYLNGAHLVRF